MKIVGLHTAKTENTKKVFLLIFSMPVMVYGILLIANFITYYTEKSFSEIFMISSGMFLFAVPIILIWLFVAIRIQKKLIFNVTGATEITRKQSPDIYNIVENLCISRGMPMPKIGIIDTAGMNAYAMGWKPENSYIVFSRGLLEKLDRDEIAAVAGHELTHIMNGDVKTMAIVNVFIGIVGTVGYILLRAGGRNKNGFPILITGGLLLVASFIFLPLIQLAISRKKEYMADAGSVELTKDNASLISALKKISEKPVIPEIKDNSSGIASMFIIEPRMFLSKKNASSRKFDSFFSTHPSLENRVNYLEKY